MVQITQEFLAEHFHDHIASILWAHSSTDLNQLGYNVRGIIERDVNRHPHSTKDSLKASIVRHAC